MTCIDDVLLVTRSSCDVLSVSDQGEGGVKGVGEECVGVKGTGS